MNYIDYFKEICGIAHVSFHTDNLRSYCEQFAKEHSLRYIKDTYGNIIIFKDASKGCENRPAVILQGHLDMVGAKAEEVVHDFINDPVILDDKAYEEGFLKAQGTTLGGDDGIAVAYALSILADDTIKHPPIEAVFTTNEEVGLLGANALDCTPLKGRYMLNLDSEEEGCFLTGCAGGIRSDLKLELKLCDKEGILVNLCISGLTGGHSGTEIGSGRPSANMLMGRILCYLDEKLHFNIKSINGGVVDNAISTMCMAEILINPEDYCKITGICNNILNDIKCEYEALEQNIILNITKDNKCMQKVIDDEHTEKILFILSNLMQGVIKRSAEDINFVETSLNFGILKCEEDSFLAGYSIRSQYASAKYELTSRLERLIEYVGGTYEESGDYPAWPHRIKSELRDKIKKLYKEMYGKEPVFQIIHAGLECGIISEKMPELDIISMGPDIFSIHTPEEKMSIASADRVYDFIVKLLERL